MDSPTGRALFFAFLIAAIVSVFTIHNAEDVSLALTHFFDALDDNHDGQVDEAEAKKYIGESIGGREFDSAVELTEAFQHMVTNIDKDKAASRKTISEDEVKQHLHSLERAVSVREWVQHGLRLPQYADAFKENVITVADFPLLINDDGRSLEEDLHVSSRLHRNQIVRGMKRLLLGLGELPSPPQVISCSQQSETQSTLQWAAPVSAGDPPVHKYLIESLESRKSGAVWLISAEIEAHLNQKEYIHSVGHSSVPQLFRIVAWTPYGRSQYVEFDECTPSAISSRASFSPQAQNYLDYRIESQKVAELAQIVSTMAHSIEATENENGGAKAGYWSIFVVAVTVALRILTTRNIAILKCCLLWKLEHLSLLLRLNSLAKRIARIQRTECCRCKHRCEARKSAENKEEPQSPSLIRKKAISHKIEPTQHFGFDQSHMVLSKSSPALGDPNIDYDVSEWNPSEAVKSLEGLPLPDYTVNTWDESEGSLLSTTSLPSTSSSSEVASGLIEGQCAFDGCLREWKGLFKFRNRWSRHFCSVCLRTYCYEHTHISPHGSFGFCGQHSSCVCETCFQRLPPTVQAQLESTNKLDKSPARKADLERGCAVRDSHKFVRSMLGIKKQHTGKSSKIHPEERQ